ncbi:hypothetical protein BOTBODRAFT_397012 [Botryobasidium botryosum FD-172 SS1]|uniref:Uncharacterized protein n=1 Tax=Botryobasidium botryosum (strain FD-172 SS1) TaxID=930990 RepID=A0A067MBM8_BOTB1|nr:hypothetical protein BOTBODRAFT_397012 [Botryobasidium botryosum FD-172 SS1]
MGANALVVFVESRGGHKRLEARHLGLPLERGRFFANTTRFWSAQKRIRRRGHLKRLDGNATRPTGRNVRALGTAQGTRDRHRRADVDVRKKLADGLDPVAAHFADRLKLGHERERRQVSTEGLDPGTGGRAEDRVRRGLAGQDETDGLLLADDAGELGKGGGGGDDGGEHR